LFEPLDASTLIVLMAAGGLFAVAGLWLMFRPQPEGDGARIELFGIKVQASSAGLLVFLIGAVFLAAPVFVPRAHTPDPVRNPPRPSPGLPSPAPNQELPQRREGRAAILLPAGPGAEEIEPNDRASEANQIEPGVYYAGRVNGQRGDPEDWFVVPVAEIPGEDMEVHIRTRSGVAHPCRASVLDPREQAAAGWFLASPGEAKRQTVHVGGWDHAFVRIYHSTGLSCAYELKVE
jgi:hypothetical protein